MDRFLQDVHKKVSILQKGKQTSIFTIATTAKYETASYTTPIRHSDTFSITGCILFKECDLQKVVEMVDGKVDYILVDSEKNIPSLPEEMREAVTTPSTGDLSSYCFDSVRYSKLYSFKPNDLTVNAVWSFLSHRLHILKGKTIAILGCGNIGSKLALKLVECGVNVHIHRRDHTKGHHIEQGLNMIKPLRVDSRVVFYEDKLAASRDCDIIIGASNGIPLIDADILRSMQKNTLIIDLGKNNLTEDALRFAGENAIEIYRADVTTALEGFIHETLRMEALLSLSYSKKDLGYCTIVGGGFFGRHGDIVVDKITEPTNIFGVAAGDGTMKKELDHNDLEKIDRLKKEMEIH